MNRRDALKSNKDKREIKRLKSNNCCNGDY